MSNTAIVRSIPDTFSGISLTTPAAAWGFSPWKVLAKNIPNDVAVTGLTFETAFVFSAVDTTQEQLFEIGIGRPDNAVTKIQIPHSSRSDNATGFYRTEAHKCFLPEPYVFPAGSTICVRVARGIATAVTYNGVKALVQSNKHIVNANAPLMNNYLFVHGSGSGSEVIW